jgi:hypothetical protein
MCRQSELTSDHFHGFFKVASLNGGVQPSGFGFE